MINHPNRNKNKAAVATKANKNPVPREDNYELLASACQRSYNALAGPLQLPLFRVHAPELWNYYLSSLPKAQRQEHDCHACRSFLHHFGSLVSIDENGRMFSVMFNQPVPELYKKAFAAMQVYVEGGRVTAPFMTSKPVWGQHSTGSWQHMAVTPLHCHVHNSRMQTAGQAIAKKVQAFKNVKAGLAEYNSATLDELLRMLRGGHLNRSESFLGPVEWLRKLHDLPRGPKGHNLLWFAVATAPEGYTHPRSAVWASVLDDIKNGVPFEAMRRSFASKTHGLIYQRPQAPPAQQNIDRAEDLVAKLGITASLDRRYARVDEVLSEAAWKPSVAPQAGQEGRGGVFSHLRSKQDQTPPTVNLPHTTMTWEKFARDVLPGSTDLQVHTPHVGNYVAVTTANDPDAPPILKWDNPSDRNPFAWYCYPNGSPASQWGLRSGVWVDVNVAVYNPAAWKPPAMTQYKGVLLVLDGCMDSNENSGNALFPECLKSELHEVRATIEAFSRRAKLGGRSGALASGLYLGGTSQSNDRHGIVVRAFYKGAWQQYHIDRWD